MEGAAGGPAAERPSLLNEFVKRKRYISSRPPFKNIL
jgi:chromate transport protein ChrA